MVHIDHAFGPHVRAKVKDEWLEWYVDYGAMIKLLALVQKAALPDHQYRRGRSTSLAASGSPKNKGRLWRTIAVRIMTTIMKSRRPTTRRLSTMGIGASDLSLADLEGSDFPGGSRRQSLPDLNNMSSFRSKSAEDLIVGVLHDMEAGKVVMDQRQRFMAYFAREVDHCNAFFVERQIELTKNGRICIHQLKRAQRAIEAMPKSRKISMKYDVRELWQDIRWVYGSLHGEIRDLRRFSRVNFDLCVRLLKKFARIRSRRGTLPTYRLWQSLKIVEFANEDSLLELSLDLEKSYANAFTYGFLGLAHKELYPYDDDKWEMFKIGIRIGMCVILATWFCWNCIFDPSDGIDLFRRPIINLYMSCAGFLLLIWFWGLNLVVWQRLNVDYASMLGFRLERMGSPKEVFAEISTVSIIYLSNLLLYYKLLRGVAGGLQVVPSWPIPIVMGIFMVYKMIFPWYQRKAMWAIILQIVISPFGKTTFCETFFADVLTSFNKISSSTVLAGCYFFSGDFYADHMLPVSAVTSAESRSCGPTSMTQRYIAPMVIFLPLWFRLLQCLRRYYDTATRFPFIPNSIKYGLSMSVVLFGIFNPEYSHSIISTHMITPYQLVWIMAYATTTLYTWVWDVKMDWDLWNCTAKQHLLRDHLLFRRNIWVYYTAIIVDLILRFLWTVTLLPAAPGGPVAYYQYRFKYFLPAVELFRRSMWAWFRLESEQVRRDHQTNSRDHHAAAGHVKPLLGRSQAERMRRLDKIRAGVNHLMVISNTVDPKLRKFNEEEEGVPSGAGDGGRGGGGAELERASSIDQDEDEEEEEYDEEEEELLAAQVAMQKAAAARRSTMVEVLIILGVFVGIGLMAMKTS